MIHVDICLSMTYDIWHTIYENWQSMIYEEYDGEKTIIVRQDDLTVISSDLNPIHVVGLSHFLCCHEHPRVPALAEADRLCPLKWKPFKILKVLQQFLFKDYFNVEGTFFSHLQSRLVDVILLFTQKSPCDPRISSLPDMNLWSPPRVSILWRHQLLKLIPTGDPQVSGTHPRCFKTAEFLGAWRLWLRKIPKLLTSEKRTSWKIECFCGFPVLSKHVSESTNQQEWEVLPMWAVSKILDALWKSTGNQIHSSLGVSPFLDDFCSIGEAKPLRIWRSQGFWLPSGVPKWKRLPSGCIHCMMDHQFVRLQQFSEAKNGSFNSKMKVSENDPNRSRWVAYSFLLYSPSWSIFPNSPWLHRAFFQPVTGLVCCLSPNPGTISF